MKVRCTVLNSNLLLTFDDEKTFVFRGSYEGSNLLVNFGDYWGRDDMSSVEKEMGKKSIDKFNEESETKIEIVDY